MKRLGTVILIILALLVLAVSCKDDKPQTPSLIITFNANGGTGSMESQTITGSGTLEPCKFTRESMRFTGWNTASDGSGASFAEGASVSTSSMTGNITLYAQWVFDFVFTITYDKNSEEAYGTTEPSVHTYGVAKALTLNGYDVPGCVFSGWNTKADGSGTSYSDGESVTAIESATPAGVTLYAVWGDEVTFVPNGPECEIPSRVVVPGSAYGTLPSGLEWAGYTFQGWFTASDGGTEVTAETIVTNVMSHALYAHWEGVTYTVEYHANDDAATGTMASSSHIYGTAKALTANSFNNNLYSFAGWTTNPDGTGTAYTDGESVSNLTTVEGGVVDLYAKWTPTWTTGTYTVSSDITIPNRVVVNGTVTLVLSAGKTLTVPKGINVPGGSSLTITGSGTLRAELTDTGGWYDTRNAAIGGDGIAGGESRKTSGNIIITGGTIIASVPVGSKGAAIGSAYYGGDSGSVTIIDGNVTASAYDGAAIGRGTDAKTINITIDGGIVSAEGKNYGCGIGNASEISGNDASVTINGGTVTATGGTKSGVYGIGSGGSIGGSAALQVSTDGISWTDYDGSIRKRYMKTK